MKIHLTFSYYIRICCYFQLENYNYIVDLYRTLSYIQVSISCKPNVGATCQ